MIKNILNQTGRFLISIFAILITALSFVLLSLQILFISLVWMVLSFLQRLNSKLTHYSLER